MERGRRLGISMSAAYIMLAGMCLPFAASGCDARNLDSREDGGPTTEPPIPTLEGGSILDGGPMDAAPDATPNPCLVFAGSIATVASPGLLKSADLNGDGTADLVVGEAGNEVFLGNGDGTFVSATPLAGATPVATGDFNGDGKLDLAALDADANSVGVFVGHGDGTFDTPTVQNLGENLYSLGVVDLDGNGWPDIAVVSEPQREVGHLLVMMGNGDGTFGAPVSYDRTPSIGGGGGPPVATDLNGDGKQDLVLVNGDQYSIEVFLGVGDGTLQPGVPYPTAVGEVSGAWSLAVGDINGDGHQDVVVYNMQLYSVGVLLGKGDGTFSGVVQYPITPNGASEPMALADVDGDGRLDAVFLMFNGAGLVFADGRGGFGPQATLEYPPPSFPPGHPAALALADFNGDGKPDLAIADTSNKVQIFLNTCGD